ncbi:MAG: hypothetical protein JXR60_04025 [Bacteroidales bacterium]|nr:hypothetical protein [Bacteroidales bacterium]
MKLKFLILWFVLCISVPLLAQNDTLTFKMVDAQTSQYYLQKDWRNLISVAKAAIKQNIDYYYLRLRLGIAYFEIQHYGQSIPHFEKALEMSPNDDLSTEYLYYAYKYTQNDIDALIVLNNSTSKWAKKLIDDQSIFENFFMFGVSRVSQNTGLSEQYKQSFHKALQMAKSPIYSEQFTAEKYFNIQLGGTIRLSPKWRTTVSFQNFRLENHQIVYDPFLMHENTNKVRQNQIQLNNYFRLADRLKMGVYFSYLSSTFNFIEVNSKVAPPIFENIDANLKQFLLGLFVDKSWSHLEFYFGANLLTTPERPSFQSDLYLSYFPMANRKLLYTTGISYLKNKHPESSFVLHQKLKVQLLKPLWLDLEAHWGDMSDWSSDQGYIIYNSIFDVNTVYHLGVNIKLTKKMYLNLAYEYLTQGSEIKTKSLLIENADDQPELYETIKFNTHSIIGGLIWNFLNNGL